MLGQRGSQDGRRRLSDLDRERAEARLEELFDQGIVRDRAERERRLAEIREASEEWELDAAMAGLEVEQRRLKAGDRRAARADRVDAVRRLEAHCALGHIDLVEMEGRKSLVEGSKTPNEIAKVFDDLAELDTLPGSAPRRISADDKVEALARLAKAREEARIEEEEYKASVAQVVSARTAEEIEAAFRGLPAPSASERVADASIKAAAVTGRLAAEGGRRARTAFLRFLFACAALLIGVVLLVAGGGTATVICFVAAVLLFVAAGAAFVTSGGSRQ
jgi:hypothetical protein